MKKTTKVSNYADDAPLTKEEMKRARPARMVHPEIVTAYNAGTLRYRGQRGKQKAPTKSLISLRVDSDVLKFFRGKGRGWQTRMSDALKAIVDAAR